MRKNIELRAHYLFFVHQFAFSCLGGYHMNVLWRYSRRGVDVPGELWSRNCYNKMPEALDVYKSLIVAPPLSTLPRFSLSQVWHECKCQKAWVTETISGIVFWFARQSLAYSVLSVQCTKTSRTTKHHEVRETFLFVSVISKDTMYIAAVEGVRHPAGN